MKKPTSNTVQDEAVKPDEPQSNQGAQQPPVETLKTEVPTSTPQPVPLLIYYAVTQQQADEINRRRKAAMAKCRAKTSDRSAKPDVHGNEVREGNVFPAMAVAVWSQSCVNAQVFLDGNDTLWVTSANEGADAGQWFRA